MSVHGVKWRWRVGKTNVIAYSEYGDRKLGKMWDVAGMSYQAFTDAVQYGLNAVSVTPRKVFLWISEFEIRPPVAPGKAGTVESRLLATISMVAGNERKSKHRKVIHEGVVKEWVGIGWVKTGEKPNPDQFPVVV